MMQRSVWFLLVCSALLAGCGGSSAGSGGGGGGGGTGGAPADADAGDEETGEGSGEGSGEEEGGGETDPIEVTLAAYQDSFGATYSAFYSSTPFALADLTGDTPSSVAVSYQGQLYLSAYRGSPLVSGTMYGDAQLTVPLSGAGITGTATGFVGNFAAFEVNEVVAFDGELSLNSWSNPQNIALADEVAIQVEGDLTYTTYAFNVDAILGGNFRGNDGAVFLGQATDLVAGTPSAPGEISVYTQGINGVDAATAILALERVTANP